MLTLEGIFQPMFLPRSPFFYLGCQRQL